MFHPLSAVLRLLPLPRPLPGSPVTPIWLPLPRPRPLPLPRALLLLLRSRLLQRFRLLLPPLGAPLSGAPPPGLLPPRLPPLGAPVSGAPPPPLLPPRQRLPRQADPALCRGDSSSLRDDRLLLLDSSRDIARGEPIEGGHDWDASVVAGRQMRRKPGQPASAAPRDERAGMTAAQLLANTNVIGRGSAAANDATYDGNMLRCQHTELGSPACKRLRKLGCPGRLIRRLRELVQHAYLLCRRCAVASLLLRQLILASVSAVIKQVAC